MFSTFILYIKVNYCKNSSFISFRPHILVFLRVTFSLCVSVCLFVHVEVWGSAHEASREWWVLWSWNRRPCPPPDVRAGIQTQVFVTEQQGLSASEPSFKHHHILSALILAEIIFI